MTNDYSGKYKGGKKKTQMQPIIQDGMIYPGDYAIHSAEQAFLLSARLESVWSQESKLTQRLLIYIASLLEELAEPQRNSKEFIINRLSKIDKLAKKVIKK